MPTTPPPHGTRRRYNSLCCRCDACRRANRDYMNARRAKLRDTSPPRTVPDPPKKTPKKEAVSAAAERQPLPWERRARRRQRQQEAQRRVAAKHQPSIPEEPCKTGHLTVPR